VNEHEHHEAVIADLADELGELMATSAQGIYAYLDDAHKLCNEQFSSLLGYESPDAWAAVHESFPVAFVAPGSQQTLVSAYLEAMEAGVASTNPVTWLTASGEPVDSAVILVPFPFRGHLLALHFVNVG
jgi:hypothetical protein